MASFMFSRRKIDIKFGCDMNLIFENLYDIQIRYTNIFKNL